jgi:uncharacterized protein YndB with AHSA1/START domain
MHERFIYKQISIRAPVVTVWKVLLKKQYIKQWIYEFSEGNVVTEDWQLNSNIAMADDDGTVQLKGTITEFEPSQRLKVEFENIDYTEELTLTAKDNSIVLSSHAGPVSDTEYKQHSEVWEKGLIKIKELSEAL